MREKIFLSQGVVIVEDHNQLIKDLNKSKGKKGYNKTPFNPYNSNNKCN